MTRNPRTTFFLLLAIASVVAAGFPAASFDFSDLPNEAFQKEGSASGTGRDLIFSSRFTQHILVPKNDLLFSNGRLLDESEWKTSEKEACFTLESEGEGYRNGYRVTYDPLCQVCGKNARLSFTVGKAGEQKKETVDQYLSVPCIADVLMATQTGTKEKPLLTKDSGYKKALGAYMAALAKEDLSAKYVELDQPDAQSTFEFSANPIFSLPSPRTSRKATQAKLAFLDQTSKAYSLWPQLLKVQEKVFGPAKSRTKTTFVLLLGGLTQIPMPGIPYPATELPPYSKDGFIPSDELYTREVLYSPEEVKTIFKGETENADTDALNKLVSKLEKENVKVAIGRIPLPWKETSSEFITEKLQQYTRVRTKSSKETLMVIDGCKTCFTFTEFSATKLTDEVVCSFKKCGVESPGYCVSGVGEKAKICKPKLLFDRLAGADTLYFFTHGEKGLFLTESSSNKESYTVLTAGAVIDKVDLRKQEPVVYSDGCFSAALDVFPDNKIKDSTGFRAVMPLALMKKGALLYVGSTRANPSYEDAYKKPPGGSIFSPLDKFIRLTTASKYTVRRRIGDAMLEAKKLAIEYSRPERVTYKLAAIGYVLYGDPTMIATGRAKEIPTTTLDGIRGKIAKNGFLSTPPQAKGQGGLC